MIYLLSVNVINIKPSEIHGKISDVYSDTVVTAGNVSPEKQNLAYEINSS